MSFASHGKKHLFSHGSWITSTVYPVFNCCTVSDEYLHILLNIYLFMYLIHFGDGDREIIEALTFAWWNLRWDNLQTFWRRSMVWGRFKKLARARKMLRYFPRLFVSLSSQVVVQFQILVTFIYCVLIIKIQNQKLSSALMRVKCEILGPAHTNLCYLSIDPPSLCFACQACLQSRGDRWIDRRQVFDQSKPGLAAR